MNSKETVRVVICSECGERIELPATVTENPSRHLTSTKLDVRPLDEHFSNEHGV